MKTITIIRKNFLMVVALATVIGFSAFKMAEDKTGKPLAPVTIYFHGEADDPTQVADAANWSDTPNGQSCDGDNLACSMEVDAEDLTPSGQLDPSKIQLSAVPSPSGYTPEKTGGSSQTQPQIFNRN
jgi:hypothetical protein